MPSACATACSWQIAVSCFGVVDRGAQASRLTDLGGCVRETRRKRDSKTNGRFRGVVSGAAHEICQTTDFRIESCIGPTHHGDVTEAGWRWMRRTGKSSDGYVWTREGWLYLAAVEDLYTRKIVGWSTSNRLTADLVTRALEMAIGRQLPDPGLLAHSDRGSQYASGNYQRLLSKHGIRCSMSRKGNCWDNAPMESFFATLKKELIHLEEYATRDEARQSLFEYIEMFYNRVRRHSALGFMSPAEFEQAA
jgi:transposase InsO family protein